MNAAPKLERSDSVYAFFDWSFRRSNWNLTKRFVVLPLWYLYGKIKVFDKSSPKLKQLQQDTLVIISSK